MEKTQLYSELQTSHFMLHLLKENPPNKTKQNNNN